MISIKKILLFPFLFLFPLFFCSSCCFFNKEKPYKSLNIYNRKTSSSYSQKIYSVGTFFQRWDLEFISAPSGNYLFLNATTNLFPEALDGCIAVIFSVKGQAYYCEGQLFQGRQKLLLPHFLIEPLLEALEENAAIEIKISV